MKSTLANMRSRIGEIYPKGETEAIIRLIFRQLKGWTPVDIVLHGQDSLSDSLRAEIEGIVARLEKHEPIQYILGEAHFYGYDFHVSEATLIPRPETEELIEMIVADADSRTDLRVLDLGTGSGVIAIALALHLKFPQVEALDISSQAIAVARQNASRLKAKVRLLQADIFNLPAQPDSLDIVVSNPPYVLESEKAQMEPNVLDYEPATALFVDDSNPLVYYTSIARFAAEALVAGGRLYFEINPLKAADMVSMVTSLGFQDVELHRDIHNRQRFLSGTKPAE